MRTVAAFGAGLTLVALVTAGPTAQTPAQPPPDQAGQEPAVPLLVSSPLPPATLLEGFRAPLGAVVTVGRERLGEVHGISVDVQDIRDSNGGGARGVEVEVVAKRVAVSYLDVDELPLLLRGIDQLLAVTGNPTQLRTFEVHYATKGELEVVASSSRNSGVTFAVEAGRLAKARRNDLTAGELSQFRTLIEAASQKLATLR
jgi:hypothetical protein